ncbi:MAG: 4-hydroxy-tetrahydrodipicolinate reductase [Treponema sp.]|jgi:4-hydroxy-tetrahydrodipicolinate reductase|nr:4-hydroxy-tetrahydrodipicolinate reductase [Treponema sp.]
MLKLILVGYGKMGKLLEQKALAQAACQVSAVVDPFAQADVSLSGAALFKRIADIPPELLRDEQADGRYTAAIEFTKPSTAVENIKALAALKVPTVVGTTGWYDRLPEVRLAVEAAGSALLYASNFSLGVNLFYRIAAYTASLASLFEDYDVGGFEIHHNKKADSPSGTAKTLTDWVSANMRGRKNAIGWDKLDRPPSPTELHFASLRVGSVPGIHSVLFDSAADTIELRHTARNREGFAAGALFAAGWLADAPGEKRRGVFTIDDALAQVLPPPQS